MWESRVDGRELSFRLTGINNQNFIMQDNETGTWWQQVSGEAILGPLKGRRLKQVVHDELSFGIWKREQTRGRVLKPDERFADLYARNMEEDVKAMPTLPTEGGEELFPPRTLVIGISVSGKSKAYLFSDIQQKSPLIDHIGETAVLIVMGDDKKSVRAFERTIDGRALEFFAKPDSSPLQLVDAETGSEWNFTGKSIGGSLAGRELKKIPTLSDYWFDWKTYHPDTEVYSVGILPMK